MCGIIGKYSNKIIDKNLIKDQLEMTSRRGLIIQVFGYLKIKILVWGVIDYQYRIFQVKQICHLYQ